MSLQTGDGELWITKLERSLIELLRVSSIRSRAWHTDLTMLQALEGPERKPTVPVPEVKPLEPDPDHLVSLCNMGFSEIHAKVVLLQTKNDFEASLTKLLDASPGELAICAAGCLTGFIRRGT